MPCSQMGLSCFEGTTCLIGFQEEPKGTLFLGVPVQKDIQMNALRQLINTRFAPHSEGSRFGEPVWLLLTLLLARGPPKTSMIVFLHTI